MGWKAISNPAMCFPRISETLTQCFTAAPQSRHKRLFINAIYQSRSCYHYSELAATVWTLPSSPPPPPEENPPTMSGHARFGMPVKSRATLQALYESVRPRPPPPTPPPTPPARQGCQLPSNQRKGAEEKLSSLTTQDGAVSLTPLPQIPGSSLCTGPYRAREGHLRTGSCIPTGPWILTSGAPGKLASPVHVCMYTTCSLHRGPRWK